MRPLSQSSLYSIPSSTASNATVRAARDADGVPGTRPVSPASNEELLPSRVESPCSFASCADVSTTVDSSSTCVSSSEPSLAPSYSRPQSRLSDFQTDDMSKFAGLFYQPEGDRDGTADKRDGVEGDDAVVQGEGAAVEGEGAAVKREGVAVEGEGAAVKREGVAVEGGGAEVKHEGAAVKREGAAVKREGEVAARNPLAERYEPIRAPPSAVVRQLPPRRPAPVRPLPPLPGIPALPILSLPMLPFPAVYMSSIAVVDNVSQQESDEDDGLCGRGSCLRF